MTNDPKHNPIEDQIIRSLDGELDDEALLELRRTLIRDPEARRLMDEHQRVDALAGDALRAAVDDGPLPFDPMALTESPTTPVQRHHWTWWVMPGAIAAAILVVLMMPDATRSPRGGDGFAGATKNGLAPTMPLVGERGPASMHAAPMNMGGVIPVSHQPERVRRQTIRDYTTVIGEDGRLYLIEIDRTRLLRRAGHPKPDGKWSNGV